MKFQDVLIKPIISEKSMSEAAKSRFTFKVCKNANKKEIKEAVEKKFKVKVLSVSTAIIKGKTKRTGTRRIEKTVSSFKKAVVELEKGQKIALFDVAQG
ncbi:MAG: 50S ribosomal protein L23 [Candidatus Levybacteria bacterium]|nr:50S ribosomal protein L23 [Candidatus Levybacteria bacterium]